MVIRTLETQLTKTQICYTYLRTFLVSIFVFVLTFSKYLKVQLEVRQFHIS